MVVWLALDYIELEMSIFIGRNNEKVYVFVTGMCDVAHVVVEVTLDDVALRMVVKAVVIVVNVEVGVVLAEAASFIRYAIRLRLLVPEV